MLSFHTAYTVKTNGSLHFVELNDGSQHAEVNSDTMKHVSPDGAAILNIVVNVARRLKRSSKSMEVPPDTLPSLKKSHNKKKNMTLYPLLAIKTMVETIVQEKQMK